MKGGTGTPMGGPGPASSGHGGWRPVDPAARRVQGFSWWDLIIIFDLVIVGALFLFAILAGPAEGEPAFADDADMARIIHWLNVGLALLMFGGLPLLWVAMTREERLEGTLRWLGLKGAQRNNWFWLGMGSFVAVGLYVSVIILALFLHAIEADPGGDPMFEQMVKVGGWPLIIAVSISAGVGEEILFRGILQRWLGVIGQAALFGAVHVNQGWIAVAFIFGVALVFGLLRRQGMPLWSLMVAHAAYDFILFGQLLIAVD